MRNYIMSGLRVNTEPSVATKPNTGGGGGQVNAACVKVNNRGVYRPAELFTRRSHRPRHHTPPTRPPPPASHNIVHVYSTFISDSLVKNRLEYFLSVTTVFNREEIYI